MFLFSEDFLKERERERERERQTDRQRQRRQRERERKSLHICYLCKGTLQKANSKNISKASNKNNITINRQSILKENSHRRLQYKNVKEI